MMQQNKILGWDIGGAHLKAAVLDQTGMVLGVYQAPCPLWKGLEQLRIATLAILKQVGDDDYRHVLTMTGELVDLFDDRYTGVKQIILTILELLPQDACLFYAGSAGFLKAEQVDETNYLAIASANWLASASFVAQTLGSGLFVDIGSTTTDILLLQNGQVQAQGYPDYQRLISQELIYTGIVRTSVMALAQTAVDQGQVIGLMAEYFATMADVYRVTEELSEQHDQTETADGAEKSILASARRLSRMIGSDFEPEELPRWRVFADHIRAQQVQKLQLACEYRLKSDSDSKIDYFIGAGIGRFLVKELAENLGYRYLDFADLFEGESNLLQQELETTGYSVAECAPAVAVAYLSGALFPNDVKILK